MLCVLVALALSAAPPDLGEDAVIRRDALRSLLDAARLAKDRGDAPELERAMHGWSSLAPKDAVLPEGLETEAAEAIAWSSAHGQFRIFLSRLEDRVSVGVEDPAQLLARVDGFVRDESGLHRLSRTEGERADRWEYKLGEERSRALVVVIDAVMTRLGGDVLLARAVLSPDESAPPAAPDPAKLAGQRIVHAPDVRANEERGPAWWWIAGGAVAAVLVGAAFWQEARF